jgi:hypothetical protein
MPMSPSLARVVPMLLFVGAAAIGYAVPGRVFGGSPFLLASVATTVAAPRPAPSEWPIHPDADHPLLSLPLTVFSLDQDALPEFRVFQTPPRAQRLRTSLRGFDYSPRDRLLARPREGSYDASSNLHLDSVFLPGVGPAGVDRGRLVFPQGPGARLEFRMDRPSAAFIKRF